MIITSSIRTAVWLLVAALAVPAGCASQRDEALMRQMEEIRKEISDFREADEPSSSLTTRNRHDDLLPLPSQATLPVVKVRPLAHRHAGGAPMARALQPREVQQRRSAEERSIALPQDELPSIVHQTLHEFDDVRESNREHGASDHLVTYRSLDALGPAGKSAPQSTFDPIAVAPPRHITQPRSRVVHPPAVAAATIPIEESSPLADSLDDTLDEPLEPAVDLTAQAQRQLQSQPSLTLPAVSESTPEEGPTAMYQQGMAALNADRHEMASQAFRTILENYPEHGLSDNALYWLGESHYDRSMFSQALPLFQDVLTKYPLGNKVPDAMVKVALCFHNLGKLDQAHTILQQVIEIYPQSEAAAVAAARLPKLAATLGGAK